MALTTDSSAVESTSTPDDRFQYYQDILIGCGLAVGGNLLISISLNLQKYTHMRLQQTGNVSHYTRSPLWWLGISLMVLGEIGNFAAYGYAPASLVAPLGTSTVVANMFIAVIFLKEKLRPEDLFGCALAVVGAFLLVNFSSKKEKVMDAEDIMQSLKYLAFLIYVCIEVVALVVLLVIKYKFKIENVLVLLLITSILGSFTVITAKGVSGMIQVTFAGYMQFTYLVFWIMVVVMLVTAVIQIKFLNEAMKSFNATIVVPTNFVFFTISAIVAGVVFYREFWGLGALDIFMFLFGCLMCFVGVYFVTAGRAYAAGTVSGEDEPTEPKETVFFDLFPSWLLSRVNQSEVQPRPDPHPHAMDADKAPILESEQRPPSNDSPTGSPDHSSYPTTPEGYKPQPNSYGATDQQ